jgi:4-amino-4-deoxy-L-arabinose transferase-like glycosyltransferase
MRKTTRFNITREETDSKNSSRILMGKDLLLVLLVGILFTAFALQWSFQNGRLTRDPGFDDVGYFLDGLERTEVFYTRGFDGLARDLSRNPPHSPWSTGLASLSFLIFGVHDWAPYLANGILVVLFLSLSLVVARASSMVQKVLIASFACSFPWAMRAVQDFRPDFAVALFTAGGILLAIPAHHAALNTRATRGWLLLSGFCFAMAFMTKPSFVLHTLLLFAYAAAIVAIRHFSWQDERPLVLRTTHTIYPLLILLVPVVFLTIPYYAVQWQNVADYVWSNTRGDNAKFWRLPMGYLGSIWFYLAGPPAKEMMKSHLIIAPARWRWGSRLPSLARNLTRSGMPCWFWAPRLFPC